MCRGAQVLDICQQQSLAAGIARSEASNKTEVAALQGGGRTFLFCGKGRKRLDLRCEGRGHKGEVMAEGNGELEVEEVEEVFTGEDALNGEEKLVPAGEEGGGAKDRTKNVVDIPASSSMRSGDRLDSSDRPRKASGMFGSRGIGSSRSLSRVRTALSFAGASRTISCPSLRAYLHL